MREIKFKYIWKRGTSIATGVYSLEEIENGNCAAPKTKRISWDVIARLQYTGLKDKNGVEIYEGDMFFDGIENCTIEWCENSASFIANDGAEKHELGEWTQRELIIGNIHQNPELLK